jgi:hypothetical protein
MKESNFLILTFVILCLTAGCRTIPPLSSFESEPTATPTSTALPKPAIQETPTKPVSMSPTPTEPTPTKTEEKWEIPDSPLSEGGPWWVFSTVQGIFAVNPDGSGLSQVYQGSLDSLQSQSIVTSPYGGFLAFLSGTGRDVELKVIKLPEFSSVAEIELFPQEEETDVEALRAILEQPSFSFSPDGKQIAFMGGIDGPTSDLYLYDLDSQEITRLTDGPSQAYQPVWSLDGRYIVHTGVSTFGTGAGMNMTGVWAVRTEDMEVLDLYNPSGSGSERIIGWVNNQTFVVYSWDAVCGSKEVRAFNIETNEVTDLWGESFRAIAFDPSGSGAVLTSNDGICEPAGGTGMYHVPADGGQPQRFLDDTGPLVVWSPEAKLFLASGNFGSWFIAVDNHGQYIDLDKPAEANVFPAVATGSNDLAWSGKSLWIGPLLGSIENPTREIFSGAVHTVTWTPNGGAVLFLSDSGLYLALKPDYTPYLISEELEASSEYSGWVYP